MNLPKRASYAWIAATLILAASLSSCVVSVSSANRAPTASLAANVTTAYSDQDVLFTATATDPNGYAMTYDSSIDGVSQSGETGTAISRYWLTSSAISSTVSVTVTNSQGLSTIKSVTVYITPAASLRIINNASYSITEAYVTLTGALTWGSNRIGSTPIPSNYYYVVVGIPDAYFYDFKVVLSSGTFYDTRTTYVSGLAMYNGNYRDFTVYDTSSVVSNNSTAPAAKSLVPAGSGATGTSRAKATSEGESGQALQLHKIANVPSIEPERLPLKR